MRIMLTPEMREMRDQVEPYLVNEGLNVKLAPNTPDYIVELDKKFCALLEAEFEKEEQFILASCKE